MMLRLRGTHEWVDRSPPGDLKRRLEPLRRCPRGAGEEAATAHGRGSRAVRSTEGRDGHHDRGTRSDTLSLFQGNADPSHRCQFAIDWMRKHTDTLSCMQMQRLTTILTSPCTVELLLSTDVRSADDNESDDTLPRLVSLRFDSIQSARSHQSVPFALSI